MNHAKLNNPIKIIATIPHVSIPYANGFLFVLKPQIVPNIIVIGHIIQVPQNKVSESPTQSFPSK